MKEAYRILDANFNRAREALRVAEDCGRFALNDPAITAMAKNLRSDLKEVYSAFPVAELITGRDTPGDIGTEISSPTEKVRSDFYDVVAAACKRLGESLRTIEEYAKLVQPDQAFRIERMRYNAYTLEQRIMQRLMVANRFEQVRLYVLISSSICRHKSVKQTARAAIAGGADCIQVREKDIPDAQLLAIAAELRDLTDETGKMLIINDRPDIAALVGADGVHLGQDDLPIADARKLLRPGAIVGRSTHNLAQVQTAINEGADYIAVGPIFATTTKNAGPLAGVDLLRQAAEKTPLPLVPIGGINPGNLSELKAAGAKRVAVSSAVCGADDPKAVAQALRALMD